MFDMKHGSAVLCPICGGPTHLSRDTGNFTCDHCGKIIVRANKSNWVPNIFNNESHFSNITAAIPPDFVPGEEQPVGLPRPQHRTDPTMHYYDEETSNNTKHYAPEIGSRRLYKKIPVPFNTTNMSTDDIPEFNTDTLPTDKISILKKHMINNGTPFDLKEYYNPYSKSLRDQSCPMCGGRFEDNEPTALYTGSNLTDVVSDFLPYHEHCMDLIQKHCPHMRRDSEHENIYNNNSYDSHYHNDKKDFYYEGNYKDLLEIGLKSFTNRIHGYGYYYDHLDREECHHCGNDGKPVYINCSNCDWGLGHDEFHTGTCDQNEKSSQHNSSKIATADYKQDVLNEVHSAVKRGWTYFNKDGVHKFVNLNAPQGTKISDREYNLNEISDAGLHLSENPTWIRSLNDELGSREKKLSMEPKPNSTLPTMEQVYPNKEAATPADKPFKTNNGWQFGTPQEQTEPPTVENLGETPDGKIIPPSPHQITLEHQPTYYTDSPHNFGFYPGWRDITIHKPEKPVKEQEVAPKDEDQTPAKRQYNKGYKHGTSTGYFMHSSEQQNWEKQPCDYCAVGSRLERDVKSIQTGKRLNTPRESALRTLHFVLFKPRESHADKQAYDNVISRWEAIGPDRQKAYKKGIKSLGLAAIKASKLSTNWDASYEDNFDYLPNVVNPFPEETESTPKMDKKSNNSYFSSITEDSHEDIKRGQSGILDEDSHEGDIGSAIMASNDRQWYSFYEPMAGKIDDDNPGFETDPEHGVAGRDTDDVEEDADFDYGGKNKRRKKLNDTSTATLVAMGGIGVIPEGVHGDENVHYGDDEIFSHDQSKTPSQTGISSENSHEFDKFNNQWNS